MDIWDPSINLHVSNELPRVIQQVCNKFIELSTQCCQKIEIETAKA